MRVLLVFQDRSVDTEDNKRAVHALHCSNKCSQVNTIIDSDRVLLMYMRVLLVFQDRSVDTQDNKRAGHALHSSNNCSQD